MYLRIGCFWVLSMRIYDTVSGQPSSLLLKKYPYTLCQSGVKAASKTQHCGRVELIQGSLKSKPVTSWGSKSLGHGNRVSLQQLSVVSSMNQVGHQKGHDFDRATEVINTLCGAKETKRESYARLHCLQLTAPTPRYLARMG